MAAPLIPLKCFRFVHETHQSVRVAFFQSCRCFLCFLLAERQGHPILVKISVRLLMNHQLSSLLLELSLATHVNLSHSGGLYLASRSLANFRCSSDLNLNGN